MRWDISGFEDLKAETRRIRQLTHPNIIRVHDFVEDASGAAISMELVIGRTLAAARLERERKVFEPDEIRAWLPQLCAALDYAHKQAKVVHRDLKPSNILLTHSGVVKVGDFGIARSLADSVTRVSIMSAGTMVYMSPQQAMGEEPTPADDIYALGATLYEMLTAKAPFHTGDVRLQLLQRKPERIASRRRAGGIEPAEVPGVWEETIAACLAKDKDVRPASAGEVAARLALDDNGPGWREWLLPVSRRRPVRTLRAWAVWSVCGLFGVGCAAWMLRWGTPQLSPKWPSDRTRATLAWNLDGDGREVSGRDETATGAMGATVPASDRFGRIDRALRFPGGAAVEVMDSPLLRWGGDAPFSVSLWFKIGGFRPDVFLIGTQPRRVGDNSWELRLLEKGELNFVVAPLQLDRASVTTAVRVQPDRWSHVAALNDGNSLRVYVNGTLAAEGRLGVGRDGRRPRAAELRMGARDLYGRGEFIGDMDEVRVWHRALNVDEIETLAHRGAPPRMVLSRTVYGDRDLVDVAIRSEFGPGAQLGDWQDVKRWHADDAPAWSEDVGITRPDSVFLVHWRGKRFWEPPRHYFVSRFDGVKPDYFQAHDELGGMALALGSWFGMQARVLVRLPNLEPRLTRMESIGDGRARQAFASNAEAPLARAFHWRQTIAGGSPEGRCEIRLRGGRVLVAAARLLPNDRLAISLGDSHAPELVRQVRATLGDFRCTVVVRSDLLRFRAVGIASGAMLFQEGIRISDLRAMDVQEVDVTGGDDVETHVE